MNNLNDWTIDELSLSSGYCTRALNVLYEEQQGKRHKSRLSKRKTRAMMRTKAKTEDDL